MAAPEVKFSACAVQPDVQVRMRLKTAASAVRTFQNVVLLSTLDEARDKLEMDAPYDVFLLAQSLSEKDLAEFVKNAKKHSHGQDAAFVLLLDPTQDIEAETAKALLIGFDGCLMEPYSVDALGDITRLIETIRDRYREQRDRGAMELLVKTLMRQVDRMAYVQSCNMDPEQTIKQLKDACQTIQALDEEQLETYLEEAVKIFETAKPEGTLGPCINYRGTCKSLKKRIVTRLLREGASDVYEARRRKI